MRIDRFVHVLDCGRHHPFTFDVEVHYQTFVDTERTCAVRVSPRGPLRLGALKQILGPYGAQCPCSGVFMSLTWLRSGYLIPEDDRLVNTLRNLRRLRASIRPTQMAHLPCESDIQRQDRVLLMLATRVFYPNKVRATPYRESVRVEVLHAEQAVITIHLNRVTALNALRQRMHLAVPGWWCRHLTTHGSAAFTRISYPENRNLLRHVTLALHKDQEGRWVPPVQELLNEERRWTGEEECLPNP